MKYAKWKLVHIERGGMNVNVRGRNARLREM